MAFYFKFFKSKIYHYTETLVCYAKPELQQIVTTKPIQYKGPLWLQKQQTCTILSRLLELV